MIFRPVSNFGDQSLEQNFRPNSGVNPEFFRADSGLNPELKHPVSSECLIPPSGDWTKFQSQFRRKPRIKKIL